MKFVPTVLTAVLMPFANALAQLSFEKDLVEAALLSTDNSFEFEYDFQNTGKQSVKITKISTSCGCTAAVGDKTEYAAGEKGKIKGRFNAGTGRGRQKTVITVHTDSIDQPQIQLTLKLDIKEPLEIRPRLVLWRKGEEISEKIVSFKVGDPSKIKPEGVEAEGGDFSAKLEKLANDAYAVHITPLQTQKNARSIVKIRTKLAEGAEKIFFVHAVIK